MPTSSAAETIIVVPLKRIVCLSDHEYARSDLSNTASITLYARPCFTAPGGFRNRLQSIGVSVSDTSRETRMAAAIVTANSCISRPTMPPMNNTGMNTAVSERVIDTMVKAISLDPSKAASIRDRPSSMCRTMFSSMTMASSTTNPTERVSAISERLSRL